MVKTLQASEPQAVEENIYPIVDVPQMTEEERQRECDRQLKISLQLERASSTGKFVDTMKHLH